MRVPVPRMFRVANCICKWNMNFVRNFKIDFRWIRFLNTPSWPPILRLLLGPEAAAGSTNREFSCEGKRTHPVAVSLRSGASVSMRSGRRRPLVHWQRQLRPHAGGRRALHSATIIPSSRILSCRCQCSPSGTRRLTLPHTTSFKCPESLTMQRLNSITCSIFN